MRCLLIVILVVLCLVNFASATYVETFDGIAIAVAAWNFGYGYDCIPGFTSGQTQEGNPGCYILGQLQNLYAAWTYITLPYGDMVGSTMTIDDRILIPAMGNAQFRVGRLDTFYVSESWDISSDTSWSTHTVVLDSEHMTLWPIGGSSTLTYVLEAPDDIGIFFGGNLVSCPSSSSGFGFAIDNFGTVTIPEPATIALLGIGALGLLRKRRA